MHLKPDDAARLAGDLLNLETRHGQEEGGEDSGLVGVPASDIATLRTGRLGNYRITRLLGTGGMGEVYEAQQESPRRRVALKIVRPHLISSEIRRRFEHEVRILGTLQHPGIAQIYEAGQLTPEGTPAEAGAHATPFFAMEYVEGEPLTGYAQKRKLGVRERLELFLRVCQAVEHAHQRGVIHRDLKPGNILVTVAAPTDSKPGTGPDDSLGQPKVLDFGVARATDADVTATSMHTEIGKLVGTLPYMSPEQAAGDPADLDTRSDVYALGVVLYELLSGKLPYEIKGDAGARAAQALRVIKEVDPTPLSSIDRVFRGDLETIVAKALEKERERRYQSVGELAADLRRYLDDEPIVARRAGAWYQVRKFAQRNRAVSVGVLVAGVALCAGSGVATWQALVAVHARDAAEASAMHERELRGVADEQRGRALRSATVASETTKFLKELIAGATPEVTRGRSMTVSDLVERAAKKVQGHEMPDPLVQASVAAVLGSTYLRLGDAARARELLEEAIQRFEESGAGDSPDSLEAEAELSNVLEEMRDLPGALALAQKVYESSARVLGPDDTDTLVYQANVAAFLMKLGRLDEASAAFEALMNRRSALGLAEDRHSLAAATQMAILRALQGRLPEAHEVGQHAVEASRSLFGEDHPQTLSSLNVFSVILARQGQLDEAARIAGEVVMSCRRVYGDRHPRTLKEIYNLSGMLVDLRRPVEAEALATELLAARLGTPGDSLEVSKAHVLVAKSLAAQARYEEAVPHLRDVLGSLTGDSAEAQDLLVLARALLGLNLLDLRRFEESESALLEGLQPLDALPAQPDPRQRRLIKALVALYEAWEKPDKVAEYRALLPAVETPRPKN